MEKYKNMTSIELNNSINKIKEEHDILKDQIFKLLEDVENIESNINSKLEDLKRVENIYVDLMNLLINKK